MVDLKQTPIEDISWKVYSLSHFDPRTSASENEISRIRRIIHLQNRLPNSFNVASKDTQFHIRAVNALSRICVLAEQGKMNISVPGKCGRPMDRSYCPSKMKGENSGFRKSSESNYKC